MDTGKISGISGILVLCLLSVISCIREDLSPCSSGLNNLQFVFTYDGMREIQYGELYQADIYVFDQNDRFVARQEIINPLFGHIYTVDFNLEAGDYSFVAWFNRIAPFSTSELGTTRSAKREAELFLDLPADRCVNTILPTQLYGSQEVETHRDKEPPFITIPMTENTNRINLTVNGLHKTDHLYTYSITDTNGSYYFDNSFAPCEMFQYTTTAHFSEGNALTSSLTVLRLAENRHPKLAVRDTTTGELIYPHHHGQIDDLIEMILTAYANGPQVDFHQTHVYDIVISFGVDMAVSITVNGWKLSIDEREL